MGRFTVTNVANRKLFVLRGVYSDTTQLNSTELNSTAWTTVDSVCRSWRHKQNTTDLAVRCSTGSVEFSWVELCRYKHPLRHKVGQSLTSSITEPVVSLQVKKLITYRADWTAVSWMAGSSLDAFCTIVSNDCIGGFSFSSESVLSACGTLRLFSKCSSRLFWNESQYKRTNFNGIWLFFIRFWYLRCCGCPWNRGRQHLATPLKTCHEYWSRVLTGWLLTLTASDWEFNGITTPHKQYLNQFSLRCFTY